MFRVHTNLKITKLKKLHGCRTLPVILKIPLSATHTVREVRSHDRMHRLLIKLLPKMIGDTWKDHRAMCKS